MEQRNNLVLQGTETFSRGQLDNVALDGGAIVQVLFWGVVILCMPLGLFLMLIFGFWFVTEVSCQIVYGDIDRVFHIEENIRKMRDAELEEALKEDYGNSTDDTEE